MKVGVVSDVHNNVAALQYALEQLAACELKLNLGDLVFEYKVDPEIIRLAQSAGLIGIVGNHEKTILKHPASSLRAKLAPDSIEFLESLPASRAIEVAGRTLHVAHGAPWDDPDDPRCAYVYERNRATMERVAEVEADVILLGHTHVPMLARVGGKLVVNPGSCGDARGAQDRLTFAELDFERRVASVFAIRYGAAPELMIEAEL
jgi:putative phosphoesterase